MGPSEWIKVIEMLQQNWALVRPGESGGAEVLFLDDHGHIFDRMTFGSEAEAIAGLQRNRFWPFTARDAEFVGPFPAGPYREEPMHVRRIYSTGEYWVG